MMHPNTYMKWLIPYMAVVLTLILTIVSVNTYKSDVNTVLDQQKIIDAALSKQKICSDSQPQFCVDLFERLSDNISEAQRERLACTVVTYFEAVQLKPGTHCPTQE
jgi:cytochrome c-type biogenesis protein CcmH/NrfF